MLRDGRGLKLRRGRNDNSLHHSATAASAAPAPSSTTGKCPRLALQQGIRLFRYFIATNGSLLRLVAFCYFKIGDSACWVDLVESAFKHPSFLQHARADLSTLSASALGLETVDDLPEPLIP